MLRWLTGLLLVSLLVAGAAFWFAGRGRPPVITIERPERVVGQTGTLDVVVEAPGGRFTSLTVALEQNGRTIPLFSLEGDVQSAADGLQTGAEGARSRRPGRTPSASRARLGKQSVPELQQGAARITVAASRPSFLNLRTLSNTAAKDFQVRLDPPRLAVVSTHHYVNHGGAEMIVYRATPPDVASGVRVGDLEYPGFPLPGADPGAEGGVLRPASRAGSQDADRRVRAGRSRQPDDGQLRGRRVPEADEAEPHR